jgi:hypothetical protein
LLVLALACRPESHSRPLGERGAGTPQIPAYELLDHRAAIGASRVGGRLKIGPVLIADPDGSMLRPRPAQALSVRQPRAIAAPREVHMHITLTEEEFGAIIRRELP